MTYVPWWRRFVARWAIRLGAALISFGCWILGEDAP